MSEHREIIKRAQGLFVGLVVAVALLLVLWARIGITQQQHRELLTEMADGVVSLTTITTAAIGTGYPPLHRKIKSATVAEGHLDSTGGLWFRVGSGYVRVERRADLPDSLRVTFAEADRRR